MICGGCGGYHNTCTCKRVEAPKTLATLLDWRFQELGESLTKYCGDDWQPGHNALGVVKGIFAKYQQRSGYELNIDPTTETMQRLLPDVPTADGEMCPYNMRKGQVTVLLDAIRLHIPAPDFLEAAAALHTVAEILKKARHKPDPIYCYK